MAAAGGAMAGKPRELSFGSVAPTNASTRRLLRCRLRLGEQLVECISKDASVHWAGKQQQVPIWILILAHCSTIWVDGPPTSDQKNRDVQQWETHVAGVRARAGGNE
jgi:hypothetical protein